MSILKFALITNNLYIYVVIFSRKIIMKMEDFEYLNMLSIKAIKDTLTCTELNEFKRLLRLWNDNLFQRSHTANTTN